MKLKWTYEPYDFAANPFQTKPVAELWDVDRGKRVALVSRADGWPEDSYEIRIRPPREFDHRVHPWSEPQSMHGDFLQAQAFALALVTLTD